jgi:hypothetical protein
MKILHQHGFNHTELLTNRQVIYRNLIESAKSLVQYLKEFDILPANPENLVRLYFDDADDLARNAIYLVVHFRRRSKWCAGTGNIPSHRCRMARQKHSPIIRRTPK